MAIVSLPHGLVIDAPCSICSVKLTPDKATAGFLDSAGCQAFACVSHLSEVEKLISGWADYMARERYKYLHQDQKPEDAIYGAGHA